MSNYRYQLERYRGRGTRHTCPQCHRKQSFTRYIDTHNNNIYISDNVGKCNRLDKCGYHYTPKQYFEDNPWKRDDGWLVGRKHRKTDQPTKPTPRPIDTIPEWIFFSPRVHAPREFPQEPIQVTRVLKIIPTLWWVKRFVVEQSDLWVVHTLSHRGIKNNTRAMAGPSDFAGGAV